MPPLSREAILAVVARRERAVYAALVGGDVLIRELSRPDFEASQAFAESEMTDPATGRRLVDLWRWHAALVAYGLMDPASGAPYDDGRRDPTTGQVPINPETRTPLFTPEEIAAWPARAAIEDGLRDLAQAILDLSDDPVSDGGLSTDANRDAA